MRNPSTKSFELEQLEPRLLLSAVPLEALPAAIPSVDHDLVLHADLNTGSPTQDSAAISYSPASQIDDILDGLAPLQASPGPAGEALSPEGVQPPASQTPPPDSAAPTLTLDPASGPTSSTTSASLPDADRGVDSGANEAARAGVTAPDSPLAHDGATPSSGSVASAHGDPGAAPSLVGQLTETLRVANAPPSDLLDVHGVGLISSFLGLFTDAPSGGLASGLPPFTPPAFGPSDSRSLSYLGHRAELSSTNDLTLFATGTIPLSELHPDLLHQAGIRSLVIQGSDATDDTLVVDLAAGEIPMPVTFNGGVGAFDTLRVGAVTGGSYTPGKVFGDGVFTSAGGTRITFTGLEPVILDGSLAAPSVVSGAATPSTTSLAGGTFTFTTPFTGGGADLITIDSPAPGQNRISGTSGGVAFESVTFSNIPHVIIDTGSNDTEGANSDSVKLVSPLVAKGLLDLRITTGAGDDTLDFSQGAAIGVPTLTLDGGTGVDTFVNSSTGLVVLTDASYSAGGKVTQLSGIESARISAGLIDATGFKGTVLALTGAPVWESAGPTGTTGGQTEGLEAQGNPVSGAILTVVINPLNPQQVFIGTTNGGVWKTDNIDATRQVSIAEYEDLLRDRAPDVTAAGTVVAENPAVTPSTLTKGAYLYRISYVNGDLGTESALSRASALPAFNLTADGKSILLSHLPTGPAGTTARNIYRMGPNDQGLYKLAGTIPDNTTTTFVDSTDGVAPRTKTVSYPHWVPLTDAWDSLGITALAFDPSDPSGRTIYAGTGNGSSSNESGPAIGLLKTTDGGVTWRVMGGTDLGMRGLKITAIAFSTPRILASAGFVGSAPAVGPVTATKGSASGGQLTPGEYRYRVTYLNTDTGEESAPSAEIAVTVGGTPREFDVAVALVPWAGKSAAQVVLTDVTAPRAWERSATEQRRLESLGRFASSVAHEFASVMTVIDMSAEMLLRADDPELHTVLLGEMRHAIQRGAILTRDILSFGRPQPTAAAPHDARVTLTDTARLLRRLLPKAIRLETALSDDALPVAMSRERLEQVLVNLCFNARDAMPSGGSLALRGYADDHWVTIEIVDSGTGMDESTRRRVFEAFFTTKPAGVGTGLGLWIVNALVDAVSGKVEIESQVDAGTTVRVRLPLLPFFDVPVAAENTGGPRGAGQRLCLSVADDTVNKAMARLLGGVGYVVVAADGPHDVLIADVSLSTEEMVARASAGGRLLVLGGDGPEPSAAGGRLLVLGGDGPEPSATLRVERIAEPVRGKAVLEALERLFTTAD